ncbi:MAG: ABC transporter substrate-binding protein [Deltaproteobacteria bacterium]|nr:ABC transporter substrate-binding protein [Deltaproteobacteria bacterium]MBI3076285.1 ABC transporter substrate-binding protein [Deltaproteobacteria bacterium]
MALTPSDRRAGLILLAGLVLGLWGGAAQGAPAGTALRASYSAPVASMAPMWIAKELRLYEKYGVSSSVVFIGSGPTQTSAMLSGELDIGVVGGFAPVRAIVGGSRDLVIVGQSKKYMVGAIVGRPELKSPQDLKGKRLGIDRVGSNPDLYTIAALARFGMDPRRDVAYIQLGDIGQGLAALQAGSIDALTTTPPFDLFATRLGFRQIVDITAMRVPFAATVLLSTRSNLERKGDLLRRFMRAYAEAVRVFLTDPERTQQVVARYTKVQDRAVLEYTIKAEGQAMERTLDIDAKGVEFVLTQIRRDVPRAATMSPEEFLDRRLVRELRESGFLASLWP